MVMGFLKHNMRVMALLFIAASGFAAAAVQQGGGVSAGIDSLSKAAGKTGNPEGEKKNPGDTKNPEDEIFNGGDTVTPSDKVKDDTLSTTMEKKSVIFSGFLNSRTFAYYNRSSILRDMQIRDDSDFMTYFQSYFGLDVRLIRGIRGFFNLSADYYPAGFPQSKIFQVPTMYLGLPASYSKVDMQVVEQLNAVFAINEIFLDVNIGRYVYFRLGKQVVKWGVSYLWTPTDLINVEKRNILDSSQVVQGTYGLKIHVPFGTRANLYSFIDMNNAKHLSDLSMANKVEILFLNTEMSLSVLLKQHNVPVYGFDFTSRVLGFDIHGEASLSYGDNTPRLREYPSYVTAYYYTLPATEAFILTNNPSIMTYEVHGKWIPKASFGFGRGFEVLDVKDRIRFDVEGFYNNAGYDWNVFEKDYYTVGYFLSNGLYMPNYYSQFYAGLFITIRQMFVQELSSMINCVVNIQDQSSIISGMITYSPFYDLALNLMISGFVGKTNREYTVYGNYLTSELSVKLVF